MIQIYYGFGKGKTTAAIGQGMRAKGAGKSVTFVQFLKDNKSSELSVLPFDIFNAPDSLPFNPGKEYQSWVDSAIDYIENSESDIIILDEFLDVVDSFLSVEKALDILNTLADREVVITGHKEIKELFEKADYITFMDKIKHPFDLGVKARKGIEY
ncbi:MAG: cob(I)yrinic acid a,c-diamide adenosyltransferase [Eubacteriales bacterium]|nr:cob(I)yrinic acid a,c-diamide adenosyltransferase [Eubacteriales bacterium]